MVIDITIHLGAGESLGDALEQIRLEQPAPAVKPKKPRDEQPDEEPAPEETPAPKPKKKGAKKHEEPSEPADDESEEGSLGLREAVRMAGHEAIDRGKRSEFESLLKETGHACLSDVPDEDLPELLEKTKAL